MCRFHGKTSPKRPPAFAGCSRGETGGCMLGASPWLSFAALAYRTRRLPLGLSVAGRASPQPMRSCALIGSAAWMVIPISRLRCSHFGCSSRETCSCMLGTGSGHPAKASFARKIFCKAGPNPCTSSGLSQHPILAMESSSRGSHAH